jgi:hypothetical protein
MQHLPTGQQRHRQRLSDYINDSDSDSDSDYINDSGSDEADHDEERAAREIHLRSPPPQRDPGPQMARHRDGQTDRMAWNKMLRSIYTN